MTRSSVSVTTLYDGIVVPNNLLATDATKVLRSSALPSLAIVAEVPMQISLLSGARRCRTRRTNIATSAPCRPL